MAERGGFEPPVRLLTVQRFSKPPPSATRPSLRLPCQHWLIFTSAASFFTNVVDKLQQLCNSRTYANYIVTQAQTSRKGNARVAQRSERKTQWPRHCPRLSAQD